MCAYSWRVPLTAGTGDLKVVASHKLGNLGAVESTPILVDWRWYYHVPSLLPWAVIVLLLVSVKENRNPQAWLILVPLVAVAVLGRMIPRLLFLPPSMAEAFGTFLTSLAAAWSAVWLLAHWLSRRRGIAAFLRALAVMLGVGGVSYVGVFGLKFVDILMNVVVSYGICALALLSAMSLSGYCCRKVYRPGRFMAWLFLWVIVVPMMIMPVFGVVAGVVAAASGSAELPQLLVMLVGMLVGCVFMGGVLGVVLYLVNLPFMLLAVRCPFFRDRFQNAFRLPHPPSNGACLQTLAAGCDEG